MNRLVIALGVTTLLFASSTAYFARVLWMEKASTAQITASAQVPPTTRVLPALRPWGSGVAQPEAPVSESPGEPDLPDAGQLAVARHRLNQLLDPVGRAERGVSIRRLLYPDYALLARSIGFPLQDVDRLVDTITEQTLQRMQRRLECELSPQCDLRAFHVLASEGQKQDLGRALGAEMFERYTQLSAAYVEAALAYELHSRLPAGSRLTDAQMNRLALALHEERQAFTERAKRSGDELDESHGFLLSAAAPEAAGATAQRIRSAAEYSQGLRHRAATILTQDQLGAFVVLQDEQLSRHTEDLQDRETAEAARRAAGRQAGAR